MSETWSSKTLLELACVILETPNPWKKAEFGALFSELWQTGVIKVAYADIVNHAPPDHPARDDTVKVVPAREIGKRGKGGSLASRKALLHSLVHIESWAIDLSWDIIARFGESEKMPRAFFDDFVKVAADEGRHFTLLAKRLEEIGSSYGEFPGHEGLWDSAKETAGDLRARLAIEHCVHEARGLDVVPQTISRFRAGGDEKTAEILESIIYPEEITHCAAGVKWFKFLCLRDISTKVPKSLSSVDLIGPNSETKTSISETESTVNANSINSEDSVILEFHVTVRKFFRGRLKPPFNVEARAKAGFSEPWYLPLAQS